MTNIHLLDELSWPFHGQPHLYHNETHYREYGIDPFPCYHHDLDLIRECLTRIESRVALEIPPHSVYVLGYDTETRTNGWASSGHSQGSLAAGSITLAGKRIPLHPAMTRYLVAHEYGHHADYDICYRLYEKVTNAFDEEYAKLRKLPTGWERYGGGHWHTNVGELIANDFRILIAEAEIEFWPHPGMPRPEEVKGLKKWWKKHLS